MEEERKEDRDRHGKREKCIYMYSVYKRSRAAIRSRISREEFFFLFAIQISRYASKTLSLGKRIENILHE